MEWTGQANDDIFHFNAYSLEYSARFLVPFLSLALTISAEAFVSVRCQPNNYGLSYRK